MAYLKVDALPERIRGPKIMPGPNHREKAIATFVTKNAVYFVKDDREPDLGALECSILHKTCETLRSTEHVIPDVLRFDRRTEFSRDPVGKIKEQTLQALEVRLVDELKIDIQRPLAVLPGERLHAGQQRSLS